MPASMFCLDDLGPHIELGPGGCISLSRKGHVQERKMCKKGRRRHFTEKETLLSKVLEVLDPDQKLEDTWAYCQDTRKGMKEPTKLLKKHSTQVYLGPSKKTSVSNTGQWLYEEKPHKMDLLHENGPRPGLHEN
ncbi:FAM47E isoform 2, partial [Pan troglodytes]